MSVFRYLNRVELLACMTVCKAWYKWYVIQRTCIYQHLSILCFFAGDKEVLSHLSCRRSCDKRLWSHMDVSRCSPLSNQALAGIIKRQPTSLDLSWTPLAKRQLNCLLTRLPGLKHPKNTQELVSTVHAIIHSISIYIIRSEGVKGDRSILVLSVSTGLSDSAPPASAGALLV